jgi:hypothetical protein
MTHYVEIVGWAGNRTDSAGSLDTCRQRRDELQKRGLLAQVVKGSGRLVIDAMGQERR